MVMRVLVCPDSERLRTRIHHEIHRRPSIASIKAAPTDVCIPDRSTSVRRSETHRFISRCIPSRSTFIRWSVVSFVLDQIEMELANLFRNINPTKEDVVKREPACGRSGCCVLRCARKRLRGLRISARSTSAGSQLKRRLLSADTAHGSAM
jgi:hypothetical protein